MGIQWPRPRPPKPPTPPPPSHNLTVTVLDKGANVYQAKVTAWYADVQLGTLLTDGAGHAFYYNIPDSANVAVRVEKTGYVTQERGIGASGQAQFDIVADISMGNESGPLSVSNRVILANGSPWYGVGVTAFPMLEYWFKDRPKVVRFVDWMVAHKAGIARVLSMYHRGDCAGIGNFGPPDVGGENAHMNGAVELADYLASRRIRLDLQVFADMQTDDCKPNNPLSQINQPNYFLHIGERMAGKWNVILGGGNQWNKNGFDPLQLPRPAGFSSRGSGLEDALPILPPWDLAEFHPSRSEFQRKFKSVYDLRIGDTTEGLAVPGPITFTEPIGIGDTNDPGRTTNDPFLMWEFAAGCKLMGVQSLYGHLRAGVTLDVPVSGGAGERTFDAMVDGWMRTPGQFAFGSYARGEANGSNHTLALYHTDALALRTYEMRVGQQSGVIVVDPQPAWTPILQDGATIKQSIGYGHGHPDTVFLMQR